MVFFIKTINSSVFYGQDAGSLFSAGVPYTFYSFGGIEGFSKVGKYSEIIHQMEHLSTQDLDQHT